MSHKWTIRFSELPQKDQKMFEEEAKLLILSYEKELKENQEEMDTLNHYVYNYTRQWNDCFKKIQDLKINIRDIQARLAEKESEDE